MKLFTRVVFSVLSFAILCSAQGSWAWVNAADDQFSLQPKTYRPILYAPNPENPKEPALLVRVTLTATHPVSIGFVVPDSAVGLATFRNQDAVVCGHPMVSKLTTICAVPRNDARRQLVILDANQAFLDGAPAGTDQTNQISVKIENYVFQ